MPAIEQRPEIVDETQSTFEPPWAVVMFNDDYHTFDEVIWTLMRAINAVPGRSCTAEDAFIKVFDVHHYGKAPVFFGDNEECNIVATVIESIGVKVIVQRES